MPARVKEGPRIGHVPSHDGSFVVGPEVLRGRITTDVSQTGVHRVIYTHPKGDTIYGRGRTGKEAEIALDILLNRAGLRRAEVHEPGDQGIGVVRRAVVIRDEGYRLVPGPEVLVDSDDGVELLEKYRFLGPDGTSVSTVAHTIFDAITNLQIGRRGRLIVKPDEVFTTPEEYRIRKAEQRVERRLAALDRALILGHRGGFKLRLTY